MNRSINQIKDCLLAGQPIVQIVSFEEKRIEGFLKKLCQQTLKSLNVYTWESHSGLSRNESRVPDSMARGSRAKPCNPISAPGI